MKRKQGPESKTTDVQPEQRIEVVERLVEIRDEMEDLANEAFNLVKGIDEHEGDRAKAYWYAQIAMALSDDHEYLGSGSCTLQDSIDALDEGDLEECDGCGKMESLDDVGFCRRCQEVADDEETDWVGNKGNDRLDVPEEPCGNEVAREETGFEMLDDTPNPSKQ